ncbi:hypothetical protein INS49_002209 [Diaporthe citri]|uniref:uncharacterized protein n=1 Tax=Diaporthe citri TaxID=83186 RepID=UPI001C7EBEA1|nr:uncharacterized protein INS49_002209 [Diaporthe citri]KAG6368009.1 hypothetical protein INS49_002209 [Diaporthe citri]
MPLLKKTTTTRPTNKSHVGRDDLVEVDQEAASFTAAPSSGLHASGRVTATTATTTSTYGEGVTTSKDLVFLSNINPILLDEETLASLEVAKADVDALQAVILPSAPEAAGTAAVDQEHGGTEEGDGVEDLQGALRGVASDAAIQGNVEEAARVLLGQEEEQPQQQGNSESLPPVWTASNNPAEWINSYARHNVVNNTLFASK